MNKITILTLIIITSVLFSGLLLQPVNAATMVTTEFQITTNTASQENPDIFGYRIVYQDNRNGDWDIYVYTLQGAFVPEARVTTNTGHQMEPAIWGDKIVYQDSRNGNWEIYMYDLTTQQETRITNNPAAQQYPAIYFNRIVWQDNRNGNWDIYMYDLTTQTETRITTTSTNQNPAISGNLIAYQKWITINSITRYVIHYFDLTRSIEIQVPGYGDGSTNPAIYGSKITWLKSTASEYDTLISIAMQDVVTGETWGKAIGQPQRGGPDIDQNYLVYEYQDASHWSSTYGYNSDIYLYNTDTQNISKISKTEYYPYPDQIAPAVFGGRVVYMDNRNGNWDIYMTMISYATTPPPIVGAPPPPGSSGDNIRNIAELQGYHKGWEIKLYQNRIYIFSPEDITTAVSMQQIGTWDPEYYSKLGMTPVDVAKPAIDELT